MTKTSKIIAGVLVVTVLLIGVGYAAIQNITLYINGEVSASPDQANFVVEFSGDTPTEVNKDAVKLPDKATVTASITDATHAAIGVSGLTAKGDTVTATYTIQNVSADLSANLSAETTNSNPEYFSVSYSFAKSNIAKGEPTTITVTIELIKTPIAADVTSTVGVTITASPAQPATV